MSIASGLFLWMKFWAGTEIRRFEVCWGLFIAKLEEKQNFASIRCWVRSKKNPRQIDEDVQFLRERCLESSFLHPRMIPIATFGEGVGDTKRQP